MSSRIFCDRQEYFTPYLLLLVISRLKSELSNLETSLMWLRKVRLRLFQWPKQKGNNSHELSEVIFWYKMIIRERPFDFYGVWTGRFYI